jgi:hypothetical protein
MALQKAITYKSIQLADAYFRVVRPQIDTSKNTMSFGVWAFPSQATASDQANMLSDVALYYSGAPYSISGSNPFEQAYAYLKTLPDFEGATNVLEAGQTA